MDGAAGSPGFDEVFTSLYPRARTVAFRILGSMPAAEDAAAEAFTRALVDWGRVGALPHRDAWILRVTANIAIDVARRRRPEPVPTPLDGSEADVTVLRITLVAALSGLSRRQREAVVLRYLVGYPEREVAAAMGLSGNSVKKHLQRGLARLRRSVTDLEGADLAPV